MIAINVDMFHKIMYSEAVYIRDGIDHYLYEGELPR